MKKRLLFALLLIMALLSGCSSGHAYQVQITKDVYFQQDKEMPFEVKVTENKKAVTGLTVTAEFSMANMDHGTTDVKLAEAKDGTYSGEIALPMGGKYEIAFTFVKDGKKTEKVITYEVKEPKGVATINGQWITQADVEFYKLINQLQLAIHRETAKQKYSGKQLEEELSYVDSQEKLAEDKNQLLTQIIRLRAMSMLAEEKGHQATAAEVDAAVAKVQEQYSQYTSAQKLITAYGDEKFWAMEKQQYTMIVLSRMVQQDVISQIKKENPKAGDQEVTYLAQQKYEELLVSQVNSLKIQIL